MFPSEIPSMTTDALGSEICSLGAHIAAATCRWLLLIGEFDRRSGAGDWECRSTAHWLNWRCGMSLTAAREHVRVARALGELPAVTEAFGRGELSYSKVRAITRIASPSNEADLVELARAGTASHVDKVVSAFRRSVALNDERAEARHEGRYARWFHDDDGSLVVQVRLAPEDGALVRSALEVAAENAPAEASLEQRRADALVSMAKTVLAAEGDRVPARPEVMVHVDAAVLAHDDPVGRCELEDGSALSPETARRLACDAAIIPLLEHDGEPLSIGRKTQSIPPAIRRALKARDRCCRFPGCGLRGYLQAHHITFWAKGGETSVTNLLLLCWFHHRAVHEGGYRIERDHNDKLKFRRPDGTLVDAPPVELTTDVVELNRQVGLVIGDTTSVALWSGERLDYAMAVDSLLFGYSPPKQAA